MNRVNFEDAQPHAVLKDFIEAFGTTIDLRSFVVRMVVAAFLGFAASFMIMMLHPRHSRSPKLPRLLPLLSLAMAMVSIVIASSLAVAIGMVGAISVVRFRARIAQPQDLVHILLTMAMGICAGLGSPWLGLLTLPLLAMAVYLQGRAQSGAGWIIRLSGHDQHLSALLPDLHASYPGLRIRQCVHTPGHGEYAWAHPSQDLRDLLQLRDFILHRAPSLKISWEHASKA